ncbi:MAG: SIMPL domain-containing protein [Candidatus Paceibacterota bacterium]
MKIMENKFFQALVYILMIVVIFFFLASINEKAGANDSDVISVTGTGEVYVTPDIGLVSISVVAKNNNVSVATSESSEKMNSIIEYLKNNSVEEKDIKTTSFNIYPVYSWEDKTGKRNLDGYEVSQTIQVKIRDLTKVGDIISNATRLGANDISSLSFTVDDDEKVKEEAKELAIKDAREKAKNLEKSLGVRLVKIVNFSEGTYPNYSDQLYKTVSGSGIMLESSIAPTIQTGQNKITSTVTITYSVR